MKVSLGATQNMNTMAMAVLSIQLFVFPLHVLCLGCCLCTFAGCLMTEYSFDAHEAG